MLVVHLFLAILAWYRLPSKIPIHFGTDGEADAWASTSIVFWFGLFVASVGLTVMIYFLTSPAARSVWNIAEKERFLKLASEQQQPILELMRVFGAAGALCVNIVFLALHFSIFLTAMGRTQGLPWWIYIFIFGAPGGLLLGLIPWDRAVRREVLKASEKIA